MKGDIISGAIAVIIVVGSTVLVLNTVNPFVEESKDYQTLNEAQRTLQLIDSVVSQLFVEAPGARRAVDLNIRDGKLIIAGDEDKIKIRLEKLNLFRPGLTQQSGKILITSGGTQMKAYESDIDGDGNTDYVLENGVMLFAVRKIGSKTSHASINTSTMIVMMLNKNLSLNVSYPRSGIFIDDKETSSYGNGYTEITQAGENLVSSSIYTFVNATAANITYGATFSMRAGQDFVELAVAHVTGI